MQIRHIFTQCKATLSSRLARNLGKPPAPKEDEALRALLLETQEALSASRQGLKFADSQALTDMYIYAIKASELRYAHLLRMAKEAAS